MLFEKFKKCLCFPLVFALLIGSAFFTPIHALADDWGDTGDTNYLRFNDNEKIVRLVTSVQGGSTADNRIRSIGWYVTITTSDGRSASAVFEKSGDGGSYYGHASYNLSYNYIVDQFSKDAGSSGESVARDFLYGTGSSGGGVIKMWAYFTWWQAGYSNNGQFNINGASDGEAGSVSGSFRGDAVNSDTQAVNYTPADVNNMFEKNPDSRFDGLSISNGVGTTESDSEVIPTMWGGSMNLSDYYPAVGTRPARTEAANDLSISLLDIGTYRENTDVIASAVVTNTGEADITPSAHVPVHFSIPSITDQTKEVIVPHNSSQLVYFKFRTPNMPGNMAMTVTVNASHAVLETNYDNDTSSRTVNLYAFNENTPPDAGYNGHVPLRHSTYFQYIDPPGISGNGSLSWGLWEWVNNSFVYKTYSASVSTKLTVKPDRYDPTAFQRSDGMWQMKSGYGVDENVSTSVSTSSSDSDAITGVQRVISFYPEFEYDQTSYDNSGYYRILERLSDGLNAAFDLQPNLYSLYAEHEHFMPVWFADNKLYTPEAYSFDVWTPSGMLSNTSTDSVYIKGSVFDDSQTGPVRNP